MANAANINRTIEVLRSMPSKEFSMRTGCMCLIRQTERAGRDPKIDWTTKWLGIDGIDNGFVAIAPPDYELEPNGGDLYPIPVAIRMLEIARDENIVDWDRARKEIADNNS